VPIHPPPITHHPPPAVPLEAFSHPPPSVSPRSQKLASARSERDNARVAACLDVLREPALDAGNLMPPILDAIRACVSVDEISRALRDVFAEYRERY
jgi:methylmalonyl-CoA mutase, N-terminal domain